jgi:hypothetical protein
MVMPKALTDWVIGTWARPWAIYFAIAVRLALGLVFILGASQTRHPGVFSFLGYLMIFAALVISVAGRSRLDKFMRWWQTKPPAYIRGWLVFGLLFGLFMIYSTS